MATKNADSKKVNVTLPAGLIDEIDEYAEEHYMTRSGFIAYACNQVISAKKLSESIVILNSLFDKMLQRREFDFVSDEEREEFERLSTVINTLKIGTQYLK